MIREAQQQGEHVGRFMEKLLEGVFPWARLRQAQKLLRLSQKYGRERLDGACRRALGFELINVHRVERIVVQQLERTAITPQAQGKLLPARFLRPAGSFTNHSANREEKSDGA